MSDMMMSQQLLVVVIDTMQKKLCSERLKEVFSNLNNIYDSMKQRLSSRKEKHFFPSMETTAIECDDIIFVSVLTQMLVYCFHSNSTHIIPVKTHFSNLIVDLL